MLTNLHVKNLALIEEADIDFSEGLNILTGETGAGKSIIIGSINYCLGAKATGDVIRSGAEYALCELTFVVDEEFADFLRQKDFPIEDDGTIILSRRIMENRSAFKVNGEGFTAKQVKELASYLIDIHGQHEHQSLLSETKQKNLLDGFAGSTINVVKSELEELYSQRKNILNEIDSFCSDENAKEREISLIRYELNEIESAELRVGEEEELNKKHKLMQNAKRITEEVSKAIGYLDNEGEGALNAVGAAVKSVAAVTALDDNLITVSEHISGAEQVLIDAYREIRTYIENFSFEADEFESIEQRLDVINRLSLKYGDGIENILKYADNRRAELEKLVDSDNYLNKLKKREHEICVRYEQLADEIHEIRNKIAGELSHEIEDALKELNFLKVNFEIKVEKGTLYLTDGMDKVSFMISLNPGEVMRPLCDVASGGEMSRIMLALKEVLAKRDNINTLIFDEIDSGISGITAWQVSKKMGRLSRSHQVICITHLPQIAAMADTHFLIEKNEQNMKTVTNINKLNREGSIDEVSRLLGGGSITETVKANADELIENAMKEKQNF